MAWMPVAEAAATLGVSERTIWRRIKSETIETKSENGRTLVDPGCPATFDDSLTDLYRVEGARPSMRRIEADRITDVLNVLSDYRSSFESQLTTARRGARVSATLAVVLAIAGAIGIVYHREKISALTLDHSSILSQKDLTYSEQTAELQATHTRSMSSIKEQIAHTVGESEAQAREIARLKSESDEQKRKLASIEAVREKLQEESDKRAETFQKTVAAQQNAAREGEQRITELQETNKQLQAKVVTLSRHRDAIQAAERRLLEATRRSAARSIGLAEGLRIRVDLQAAEIVALRKQVENSSQQTDERRSILQAVVGTSENSEYGTLGVEPTAGTWKSLLESWFSVWLHGPTHKEPTCEMAMAD